MHCDATEILSGWRNSARTLQALYGYEMIREAAESDCDSINELSEYLGYGPVTNETARVWIHELLNADNDKLLIFESDVGNIGWIHASVTYRVASPPFIEISGLVVAPEFRRKGVGTELVKSVEAWANSLKLKVRVRSNLIREETHGFFESLGFIKSKSQHVFEKSL